MSTADETTAPGTGGKFRKRPFRRQQTTPYDRPLTAIRPVNNNNNNWLTRHVVDPASKFISYGANRFFDSILGRKRITQANEEQKEVNRDVGGGLEAEVSNELIVREPSRPINSPNTNGISDLEQLLKGNTFTRSEIDRLTELLHSKAAEASHHMDGREKRETKSGYNGHEKTAGGLAAENRNRGIIFHGTTPASLVSPNVLEDDVGSPAELAKAYMGSRPSTVSPSMLSMHGHGSMVHFDDTPFNSKSPILPFAKKSSLRHGAVENGFITPRSRGRTAMYSMARTPYPRGHSTSIVKFQGLGNNGNQSVASSSRFVPSHNEQLEFKSTALKRRSSYLDDEVGSSVGPIRRIRQKHNLLAPRVPHKLNGSGNSSAKQKQLLIGEGNNRLKGVVENEIGSVPSTSYASVPSKSSEMASKILHHLDELTPREKSSNKSPFELTPGMLHGQALRSMENIGTSKFMQDLQDDHKMDDCNVNFSDARDSTSEKLEKVEEKGSKESIGHLELWNSTRKNESVVSFKDPGPSRVAFESVARNSPSQQPPQKKRAFRMSALEDSFDQDDDVHNGVAPAPLPEKKAPTDAPLMESNLSTVEEPKPVKTTIQPEEVKSTPSNVLRKTSDESGFPRSGNDGDSSGALVSSTPEESVKALQPAIVVDKPKDNPSPLFPFSSSVGNNFSPLPSESTAKTSEAKLDGSSSFITTPVPNDSPSKTPGTENGNLNPPKPADKIQKLDTATPSLNGPFASNPSLNTFSGGNLSPSKPADQVQKQDISTPTFNGPVTSNPPTFSFNTSSPSDKNQRATTIVSTVSAPLTTSISSSTSSGIGTSSAPSFAGLFGSIATSKSKEPIFRFTAATYPSTSVSTASTTITSAATDSKTNTNQISGVGSNPTLPPVSSASFGTSTSGVTSSAPVTPQSSPFNGVPVTQSSSAQLVSNTPFASFSTNTSTPFGSSFSNSQPFNPTATSLFGSTSASSSATSSNTPVTTPASTVAEFSSTTSTNTTGFSSAATSSPFVFGGSSSSTPVNANGSSSAATSTPFIFGGSFSSAPTSTIGSSPAPSTSPFIFGGNPSSTSTNTIGSSPAATSQPFNFGANSFTSSAAPVSSSSAPSNPFGSSVFGSSSAPSTTFLFGTASSTPNAPTPSIFTSTNISSSPVFPFSAQSTPSLQTPSQPVFGGPSFGFGASPGNNMNAEDSMAEDPVQSTSVFGQQAVSASPPPFMFGQPPPAQVNPFQFGGQHSQVGQVNPNPFQASGSVEFNNTGSFSLGTGGGDKSGRRIVKPSKNRNRKK